MYSGILGHFCMQLKVQLFLNSVRHASSCIWNMLGDTLRIFKDSYLQFCGAVRQGVAVLFPAVLCRRHVKISEIIFGKFLWLSMACRAALAAKKS